MQRLEETELRKADLTVGVNCYIFSKISSGAGIGKLIHLANHNWVKLGLLDVTTGDFSPKWSTFNANRLKTILKDPEDIF